MYLVSQQMYFTTFCNLYGTFKIDSQMTIVAIWRNGIHTVQHTLFSTSYQPMSRLEIMESIALIFSQPHVFMTMVPIDAAVQLVPKL